MGNLIKQKIYGIMKIWEHGKILFLILLFLMSCIDKSPQNANGLVYYNMTNISLIDEIVKYSEEVKPSFNTDNIIHIDVTHSYDTITYIIYYSGSAFGIIHTPATVFAQVNNNTIAISFGATFHRNEHNEFILPDSIAWLYLKDVFKNEYEYYMEYNYYPAPPTVWCDYWILKYKNGKLISKKVMTW